MKQPVEPQLHNFPLPSTPFVGRSEEIEEITRLLSDSDCQLLTLEQGDRWLQGQTDQ